LLRACEVTGTSSTIQSYLQRHCDCHPLVIGVVAGLVNEYGSDRGNFDAWAANPLHGGRLDLGELNLVQKRNHILETALTALPEKSRELLSTLALLSEAVDYEALSALNPHLPPQPEDVPVPDKPEDQWDWRWMSTTEKADAQREYHADLERRTQYEQALEMWWRSAELLAAPGSLAQTVSDLERRGLLQYDPGARRYDLHPVVRGIAAGRIAQADREQYGQRVVDHFSRQAHRPYEEAEALDDVRDGLHIIRTLLLMGRLQQAFDVYQGDMAIALHHNLEAHAEVLSLLRPYFPHGWTVLPVGLHLGNDAYLANEAGIALTRLDEFEAALAADGIALISNLRSTTWGSVCVNLSNISVDLLDLNRLARCGQHLLMAFYLSDLLNDQVAMFRIRLKRFGHLAIIGQWEEAEALWRLLDPMGRIWPRTQYRPGDAEYEYAKFCFWSGSLQETHLANVENLAKSGRNRRSIRSLHALRGEWWLEQGLWELAAESLSEAVRMAREVGISDQAAESTLVLARFHLGQIADPRQDVEQLSAVRKPAHRRLADLWLAIGDREQAKKHALAAYRWAWADGEPYVHRYELNKATALLKQLGVEIPNLPPYDPAKDPKLPWEDEVEAAIAKLRAEKEAERQQRQE
jgi:hypothetical protein